MTFFIERHDSLQKHVKFHFCYPEKLQSKVSKLEVRREVIGLKNFRSCNNDYIVYQNYDYRLRFLQVGV